MKIIPAILVSTFAEFTKQARRLEGLFDLAQIDVMDGVFVPNKSFGEIEEINKLKLKLNLEIHLMVERPLAEIDQWAEVKNITRVIFHVESKDDPDEVIAKIRGKCWQVGIALNPETPLSAIEPYCAKIDEVLFMTVHPGQQGAKFLPEVGEKIKQFISCHPRGSGDPNSPLSLVRRGRGEVILDSRFRLPRLPAGKAGGNDKCRPIIAVDGGINQDNIAEIKSWGVELFSVGSALTLAKDINQAKKELEKHLC